MVARVPSSNILLWCARSTRSAGVDLFFVRIRLGVCLVSLVVCSVVELLVNLGQVDGAGGGSVHGQGYTDCRSHRADTGSSRGYRDHCLATPHDNLGETDSKRSDRLSR